MYKVIKASSHPKKPKNDGDHIRDLSQYFYLEYHGPDNNTYEFQKDKNNKWTMKQKNQDTETKDSWYAIGQETEGCVYYHKWDQPIDSKDGKIHLNTYEGNEEAWSDLDDYIDECANKIINAIISVRDSFMEEEKLRRENYRKEHGID